VKGSTLGKNISDSSEVLLGTPLGNTLGTWREQWKNENNLNLKNMISTYRKDFPWKKNPKYARFWKKKNLPIARFLLLVLLSSQKYFLIFIFYYVHISTRGEIWLQSLLRWLHHKIGKRNLDQKLTLCTKPYKGMVRDTTFSVIFISFVWALLFMWKLEPNSKHIPNIAFVSTRARFSIIHFFEKKPFSVSIQLNSQV
jgi:hypothetical protein